MFDRQLLLPALDEAEDFILVTDDTPVAQGGPLVVYANRSFLQATGFSEEELFGRSISTFYSPRNLERILESIANALERRETNSKEILAMRKDGSEFWLECVAKPFWRGSTSEYWLWIGRDISIRRRSLSQMALLFAAIENTTEAISLYEPAPDGSLQLSYENEQSFREGDGRLLNLWTSSSEHANAIRVQIEQGSEVQDFFAELDRQGLPRLVQFNALAIRSDSRIEGIVTLERTVAHANEKNPENYRSLLLRIATVLPALASARTPGERLAMLRAILLDCFDADLYESENAGPEEVHIAAGANLARFSLDGRSMLVRWAKPLENTALTAMRFCIEAAIEQSKLPESRSLSADG